MPDATFLKISGVKLEVTIFKGRSSLDYIGIAI